MQYQLYKVILPRQRKTKRTRPRMMAKIASISHNMVTAAGTLQSFSRVCQFNQPILKKIPGWQKGGAMMVVMMVYRLNIQHFVFWERARYPALDYYKTTMKPFITMWIYFSSSALEWVYFTLKVFCRTRCSLSMIEVTISKRAWTISNQEKKKED